MDKIFSVIETWTQFNFWPKTTKNFDLVNRINKISPDSASDAMVYKKNDLNLLLSCWSAYVVTATERSQVSVVGRRRNRHAPRTSRVDVTQIVRKC
jgi:hypothetical protein